MLIGNERVMLHTEDKNGFTWPVFCDEFFVKIPLGIQIVEEFISDDVFE